MPAATINLLFSFLRQNDGALSKRVRTRELLAFSDAEVVSFEALYQKIFKVFRNEAK